MGEGLEYHDALVDVRSGKKMQRSEWNGKGMYIFLISNWDAIPPLDKPTLPFIAMKTADGSVVPWLCSQTDALADDWQEVE